MEKPFPAYKGDEPYVFVCYAHADAQVVYAEMAWLREYGVKVWYDEGIAAGKNWRAAIGDSLLDASRVLFYISHRSLVSDHCNREINLALDEGKHIVPVYLEKVELTSDLKVGLNRVQALHRDQDLNYRDHLAQSLLPHRVEIPGSSMVLASPVRAAPHDESISIAVLPLRDLSSQSDQRYFSDGITEDILNRLSRVRGLRVIARASSFYFRDADVGIQDIARNLDVSHVLDGSVRKEGDQVRLNARLIAADSDALVWSDSYNARVENIFATQDSIADSVVSALEITLGGKLRTPRRNVDPLAYELALKANEAFRSGNWQRAAVHLEEVIRIDDSNADACALLARVVFSIVVWGGGGDAAQHLDWWRTIERYATQALALDAHNAMAAGVMAATKYRRGREIQAAIQDFESVIRRDPRNVDNLNLYTSVLGDLGRYDDSLALDDLGKTIDPYSRLIGNGIRFIPLGRFEDAQRSLDRTLRLYPGDENTLNWIANVAIWQRKWDECERVLATLESINAQHALQRITVSVGRHIDGGRMDEAAAEAAKYHTLSPMTEDPGWIASLFLAAGDFENALEYFRRGAETRSHWTLHMRTLVDEHRRFGSKTAKAAVQRLLKDERYDALLTQLRIDDESVAKLEFNLQGLL